MKTYRVHFTYYSENYGQFDESVYKVDAENPFEARQMAWSLRDTDDEARFQSFVQQCGVTWDASPLDMADYFNAMAAYDKYRIKYIQNVEMLNAKIKEKPEEIDRRKREIAEHYGSLWTIQAIAADFGRPHMMRPPVIYEELHYAREFLNQLLYNDWERYNTFQNKIERAEKWDQAAMLDIRDSFQRGYFSEDNYSFDFSEQYGRDGIYPVRTGQAESEYEYTRRWTNARNVETLNQLPMYGEKDIIKESESLPFDYRTLVLRHDALTPEYRKPENILWTPHCNNSGVCENLENASPDTRFNAENMITGVIAALQKKDFIGVLRPEHADNINFDALKQEYAAQHAEINENEGGVFENTEPDGDDDWEDEL